jgi:hypothetical protein
VQPAIFVSQRVAGQDGVNILNDRQRLLHRAVGQVALDRRAGEAARDKPGGEEGAHFGREDESLAVVVVVKRLDSQPVTNQGEAAAARLPEAEREHPAPISDGGQPARAQAFEQNFGVRARVECVSATFELTPDFVEVEDLAVISNPAPGRLVAHRLVAGWREVEDRETPVPEDDGAARVLGNDLDALVVRAAMTQGAGASPGGGDHFGAGL